MKKSMKITSVYKRKNLVPRPVLFEQSELDQIKQASKRVSRSLSNFCRTAAFEKAKQILEADK